MVAQYGWWTDGRDFDVSYDAHDTLAFGEMQRAGARKKLENFHTLLNVQSQCTNQR